MDTKKTGSTTKESHITSVNSTALPTLPDENGKETQKEENHNEGNEKKNQKLMTQSKIVMPFLPIKFLWPAL